MSYYDNPDPNLIAFLTPPPIMAYDCLAEKTISLPANRARRVVPGTAPGTSARARANPYETPPPEGDQIPGEIFGDQPRLELRFDTPPRSGPAFIIGTASDCDIVLTREESPGRQARGLSRHHCSISFDSRGRLVLRDLSSGQTTRVTAGGNELEKQRDGTWFIAGHETVEGAEILVQLIPRMEFEIRSPNIVEGAYAENIRLFRESRARLDAYPTPPVPLVVVL